MRLFPLHTVPLIAFGGVSDAAQLGRLLEHEAVVAAGIGNFLSYREHAVQKLRQRVAATSIRAAIFSGDA